MTPTPQIISPLDNSQVSIAPSIASTVKQVNHCQILQHKRNKTAARWKRLIQRRQEHRETNQRDLDILQLIIEQNQRIEQPSDLMTDSSTPDSDSTVSSDDSLFDPPALDFRYDSDSDSNVSSASNFTVELCFLTSSTWFDNPAQPPPGCVLDFWDKPFSAGTFHDFPELFRDGLVTVDTTPTEDITDDDSSISSVSSLDIPLHTAPLIQTISATTRVVNIGESGELVDSGGNFNMCNDLSMMVNVQPITPFGISMAAAEEKSEPTCTHCGDFPIPMLDGSVFYTPMYYNPRASDCILSPHAICRSSRGFLTKWIQEGDLNTLEGTVAFYNKRGDAIIRLHLQHRNGLFYTTTSATAINHPIDPSHPSGNRAVYLHTEEDIGAEEDEEASLDWDYLLQDQASANITIDATTNNPRRQQLEADLWQARLGHCGEWQLKVIPHAVEGTPTQFTPHPFSTYEHYNRARIRKIPATKGKHPSRATAKQQRFYMDFGFLRASNFDYSRPDKSKDRIIESFDGYNSYLLVVDEHTKYIWIFLCKSKEPPMDLVNLHLDIFGSTLGGSIRCDQGGELARSHDFVTQMALRHYTVEPTGADNPSQNKAAEKWNVY